MNLSTHTFLVKKSLNTFSCIGCILWLYDPKTHVIEAKAIITMNEIAHLLSIFFLDLRAPFIYMYFSYFIILTCVSKMYALDKNHTSPLCILCMLMPQIIPLFTLTLICTRYEESNGRMTVWAAKRCDGGGLGAGMVAWAVAHTPRGAASRRGWCQPRRHSLSRSVCISSYQRGCSRLSG